MLAKEMLTLPSFADSTVIAGEDHLDNEIESAMILEGPDIQNWGRRNQLIISSFYALEDLDESGLGRFFRTMGTIGIGAFAFKPGRAVEEVPRAIIELCEDFDLPLIRTEIPARPVKIAIFPGQTTHQPSFFVHFPVQAE